MRQHVTSCLIKHLKPNSVKVAPSRAAFFFKIALFLSMIIQLVTAIVAVSMVRRTRYNISWILISIAFVLMDLERLPVKNGC